MKKPKKKTTAAQVEELLVELVNALRAEEAGNPGAMVGKLDETEEAMENLGITRHVVCTVCNGDGEDKAGDACQTCEGAGNILPEDI